MRTSHLQAKFLTELGKDLVYGVGDGPAPVLRYPTYGPYDERLGYIALPTMLAGLKAQGYSIQRQARQSQGFRDFMDVGGFGVFPEKTSAGLVVLDRSGRAMHGARYPERVYGGFDEVPPLLVATLLFIENRELLDDSQPTRNPAVEWDRFVLATAGHALRVFASGDKVGGGSTLATQIEKYRHSPGGQTGGVVDKLRQMGVASLRAYLDGPDTTRHRRRIVVDYLNSTPLTARAGFGEINGIGDGLWAWFGSDFETVNAVLAAPAGEAGLAEQGRLFKQVLSLLLAQRRPSHYLLAGREDLAALADSYLRRLAADGIVDPALAEAAQASPLAFRSDAQVAAASFADRKAVQAVRARLLSMLEVPSLYQLDRLDLTAATSLDAEVTEAVSRILRRLGEPRFLQEAGMTGLRMLDRGDPANVIYSFTLIERGSDANYLRVQADNLDRPLDINDGAKLDLGSTAKLRTLATYLEVIAELHRRYGHLGGRELDAVAQDGGDPLTRWAAGFLQASPRAPLVALLEAAMERRYSASTAERFLTGGSLHSFSNFEARDDGRMVTVAEAIRDSINLPFIRIMRDIVAFHQADGSAHQGDVLGDADNPARREYLERFADEEGKEFLVRFYRDYRGKTPDEALALLASKARPTPDRVAVIHRSVRPEADLAEFSAFMRGRLPAHGLSDEALTRLYDRYAIDRHPLHDRGFLARVHPLELWLVGQWQREPSATRREVIAVSATERRDAYEWLFKTRQKAAQDIRIRTVLEEAAFARIHASWARLGYPFASLVPSLATAIGSSADRPAALAELVGIIQNGGLRRPIIRVERLHFAAATPYEALLAADRPAGERVMAPEVARLLRRALVDVVDRGTARRVRGTFTRADGGMIEIGGKTGTGDARYEQYGRGGRLIESRVVSRSATFAFLVGSRFFGTLTAHVHGPEAAEYRFTSALSAQLLRTLAPALKPMIEAGEAAPPADERPVDKAGRRSQDSF